MPDNSYIIYVINKLQAAHQPNDDETQQIKRIVGEALATLLNRLGLATSITTTVQVFDKRSLKGTFEDWLESQKPHGQESSPVTEVIPKGQPQPSSTQAYCDCLGSHSDIPTTPIPGLRG